MRIGFLGLGTMGEPIANNLRSAGHDLTVWNRTAAKTSHIVSKGGKLARTPRECATGRDLVFTCVSDEKALEAVLEGPTARSPDSRPGDMLVDLSTAGTRVRPQRREAGGGPRRRVPRGAHPRLEDRGGAGAGRPRSSGGPPAAREKARPALHAVSARIFELDDAVHAALMKLCVNAVGGAMIAGFGEALALGASGGLPIWKLVEVIQASPFHSPLFLVKGELVEKQDYSPASGSPSPRRTSGSRRRRRRTRARRSHQRGGAPAPRRGRRERPGRPGRRRRRGPVPRVGERRSRLAGARYAQARQRVPDDPHEVLEVERLLHEPRGAGRRARRPSRTISGGVAEMKSTFGQRSPRVVAHLLAELGAVHSRHPVVDEREVGRVPQRDRERLDRVRRRHREWPIRWTAFSSAFRTMSVSSTIRTRATAASGFARHG